MASRIFCGFSPNVFLGFRDVSHHVGSRSRVIFRITELSVLISALKRPRLFIQHMSIMSDKKSFAVIDVDEKKLVNGRLRKLICFALTLRKIHYFLISCCFGGKLIPVHSRVATTNSDWFSNHVNLYRSHNHSLIACYCADSFQQSQKLNLREQNDDNECKALIRSGNLSNLHQTTIYFRKEYMHVIHRLTAGKVPSLKSSCAVIQFL